MPTLLMHELDSHQCDKAALPEKSFAVGEVAKEGLPTILWTLTIAWYSGRPA